VTQRAGLTRTADVVIVGAGVMGASIAHELGRRGAGRVVVVERQFVAAGPTGRSSAALRRHYSLELYARMATRSLEIYRRFAEVTGVSAGIKECGILHVVGPEDLPALETTVHMLQRIGADAEALDPEGLRKLLPEMHVADLAGGAFDRTTGYADPVAVTQGYARRVRELGVTIHQDTAVTGLTRRGGRIAAVETDRGEIDTPAVVNAAGPWAARVARMAGVELPITAARTQLAAFRVPADFGHPLPIVGDGLQLCYVQPEVGGLVLVGPRGRPGASTLVDPDGYDERLDPERAQTAAEALCRRFPAMERAAPAGGYASVYDVTPDSHFVLEASPDVPGLFTAAGFNGHGFKHAPVIGAIMADLVLDGQTREFDIAPFASRRFTDGRRPWRGLYPGVPF
jgi:glycine/D-amino acid oxidase-like deaminating enzyme